MKIKNALVIAASFLVLSCSTETFHVNAPDTPMPEVVPQPLKVATWNTEHLASPSLSGCKPRQPSELDAMKRYAKSLDADIIALQEVASKEAIAAIFPAQEWKVILSSRADSPAYECRGSGYTSTQQKVAFVVKNTLPIGDVNDFEALALDMPGLRYGLAITLDEPTGPVTLLNVHLKSGCFVDDYQTSDERSCQVYGHQAAILENWIAQQQSSHGRFIIMGDFNHRLSLPQNRFRHELLNMTPSPILVTDKMTGCHPRYPVPIDHIIVGGMPASAIASPPQVHLFDDMHEEAMLSDHCAVSFAISP
ncbi:endonuclease/exonuclease/phosphatase family protein [Alteromonas sp. C1M14]|uniref:endonuclease/exonuclease/phosphatase family protein n=1 Tax=Alteromonas sp. C1M14 TaxID=2841567 RepID=UPI001C0A3E9B|nr:endonuclease/exonuclease/phosphatase family protein [Alteromonas sp. C1M14]MBU2978140.1 endonuclease/exonuclease/phosphatase family protein [Alteromonas sp. C1M14]